ncbi:protein of unknown function (plasmid) [Pararobbsia alpina]
MDAIGRMRTGNGGQYAASGDVIYRLRKAVYSFHVRSVKRLSPRSSNGLASLQVALSTQRVV